MEPSGRNQWQSVANRQAAKPAEASEIRCRALRPVMVRRGSTVRVRQRALQNPRTSGCSRSDRLAFRQSCAGYGAVYGASKSRTASAKVHRDEKSPTSAKPRRARPGDTELSLRPMCSSTCNATSSLLPPLAVGDRLPLKLDREGEPQWLVVVDVLSSTSYLVRYPDGSIETLVDSE
jgi:hypothetical protein